MRRRSSYLPSTASRSFYLFHVATRNVELSYRASLSTRSLIERNLAVKWQENNARESLLLRELFFSNAARPPIVSNGLLLCNAAARPSLFSRHSINIVSRYDRLRGVTVRCYASNYSRTVVISQR